MHRVLPDSLRGPAAFRHCPPPPTRRARSGQCDTLFGECNPFVPKTRKGHQVAERAEILRVIRVERDRPRRGLWNRVDRAPLTSLTGFFRRLTFRPREISQLRLALPFMARGAFLGPRQEP